MAVAAVLPVLNGDATDLLEHVGALPDRRERRLEHVAARHARCAGEPDTRIDLPVAEHGQRVPTATAQIRLPAALALHTDPKGSVVVDRDADLVADRLQSRMT